MDKKRKRVETIKENTTEEGAIVSTQVKPPHDTSEDDESGKRIEASLDESSEAKSKRVLGKDTACAITSYLTNKTLAEKLKVDETDHKQNEEDIHTRFFRLAGDVVHNEPNVLEQLQMFLDQYPECINMGPLPDTNDYDEVPIVRASVYYRPKVVELLLSHGANPNLFIGFETLAEKVFSEYMGIPRNLVSTEQEKQEYLLEMGKVLTLLGKHGMYMTPNQVKEIESEEERTKHKTSSPDLYQKFFEMIPVREHGNKQLMFDEFLRKHQFEDAMKLLSDPSSNIDVNKVECGHLTDLPLGLCIGQVNSIQMMKLMLEKGANVKATSKEGGSIAGAVACNYNFDEDFHKKAAALLMDHGARFTEEDMKTVRKYFRRHVKLFPMRPSKK